MGLSLYTIQGGYYLAFVKPSFRDSYFQHLWRSSLGRLSLSLSLSLLGGPYPSLLMQKPQLYVPLQIKASKTLIYSEKE